MSRNQSATTPEIVYGKKSKIYQKSIWKSQQHHSNQNWIIYVAINIETVLTKPPGKAALLNKHHRPFSTHTARISPRIGRAHCLVAHDGRDPGKDTHGPQILLAMSRAVSVEIAVSRLTPPKTNMLALENPFCWKMNFLLEWPILR